MKYAYARVKFAGDMHEVRIQEASTLQSAIDGIYSYFEEVYETNVLMIPLEVVEISYGTCND